MVETLVLLIQLGSLALVAWGGYLTVSNWDATTARHFFDEAGSLLSLRPEDYPDNVAPPPLRPAPAP